MQARFLRSLLLLLFLNVLVKPFWLLGIDRSVQNIVGNEIYGWYYALFSISLYLQIILDPGLHTHNNKLIATDSSVYSRQLSELLPLKSMLAVVYLIATLGLAFFLGYDKVSLGLLLWIGLNQVFASMILYFRSNFGGLYLFNTDSIFSVLDRLLMILICGILIWGGWREHFRIEWFVYAQTASSGITALAAAWVAFSRSELFLPKMDLKAFRRIVLKSYPFAVLTILMTLYSRIDILMLERLLPDGNVQAGLYASAYRLLEAANMIAFLFATILLPVFSGMIAKGDKKEAARTASVYFRLLFVPGFLLVVASYTYREQIMTLLYKENPAEAAGLFGLLMISFIPYILIYIYGTFLTAEGSLRFLNLTALGGLALNVVINILLIFRFGAKGAVIATLITQGIISLLHSWRAKKILQDPVFKGTFLKILAFSMLSIASFWLLDDLTGNWVINLLILTGINLTFAAISGLVRLGIFLNTIKNKQQNEQ